MEVLSPCVTHNKVVTYPWIRERMFYVEDILGYSPENKEDAWGQLNVQDKIATGLIYRESRRSYDDLALPGPQPVVDTDLEGDLGRMEHLFKEFK